MKALIVIVAIALCGSVAIQTHAETVSVAGNLFKLDPPQGYCALDARSGNREFFLKQRNLLRPKVELIQISVPCDQLKLMVTGKIDAYSRWAQVQAISSGPEVRTLQMSRSQFVLSLTKFAKGKPLDIDAVNRDMRNKLASSDTSVVASGMKIVGSDAQAMYISLSEVLQSAGVSSVIVAFGAVTLIKKLPIAVYAYQKQGAPPGKLPPQVAQEYLKSVLDANND